MIRLAEVYNNRELAITIWSIILFASAALHNKVRKSFVEILKALLHLKIMAVLAAMLIYMFALIFILFKLSLSHVSLLKDAVLWFIFTVFIMMSNIFKANQDGRYFKKLIISNLRLALVLEFIVNLYPFSLPVELLLMPFLFIAIGMSTIAGMKTEHKPAKKLINFLLSVLGIYLTFYAFHNILTDFRNFATLSNLFSFLLPLALAIAFIPFLYSLALFAAYDSFYARLSLFLRNSNKITRSAKLKIFCVYRFDLRKLNEASKEIIRELILSENEEDVLGVVMKYR
jgi:hypothetical protein